MPSRFDLLVRRNTWLHRLDPRVKFLFVSSASLLPFIWPTIWSAVAILGLCLILLGQAQVPRRRITGVARRLVMLLIVVSTMTALFSPVPGGNVLFALGPVSVSLASLQLGVMLALRLLALTYLVYLWLFTTDQATMVRGFLALGLPYAWGLTLALALRYLPVFAGLFDQVREAQQARGLDLQQGSFWQRVRLYRPVLTSMIIIAVRQSEQLGWALEARAFDSSSGQRTVYHPLHMQRPDWLALVLSLSILVAALALRLALR